MGLTFFRELFQHPEEINSIRDKILDTAAELTIKEGFSKLGMRKIASRLGITATNLYYYLTAKLHTPKYTNYVGMNLEKAASDEKLKSTRTLQISMDVLTG
jgi:hypothetical protein